MLPVPEDFPTQIAQTAIVRGVTQVHARHSMRRVRYAVRLPTGVFEPAVSAHHISAIVESAGGPQSRFTGADVSNLINGRHSKSLLDRIPPQVEIFSVIVNPTDRSQRGFSPAIQETDAGCLTDPEPAEQATFSTSPPSEAPATDAGADVPTRGETVSEPPLET